MTSQPSSNPWSRYLRLSLRALIVSVLIIGGLLGWMVHRARVQRDAVAAIQQAGGSVLYDWQRKNGRPDPNREPLWPKWLVDRIGVDYFGNGSIVVLVRNGSDATLAQAGRLSRLVRLNVTDSPVTDAGLAHLEGLTDLRGLNLARTAVSDPGLSHLSRLTRLETLTLDRTSVGDTGMAHLKGLTRLRWLNAHGTEVGDVGVAHLKGLIHLERLNLSDTRITDAALANFESMTELQWLVLQGTTIGDTGLAPVYKLGGAKSQKPRDFQRFRRFRLPR
jgi:hypothetical protein